MCPFLIFRAGLTPKQSFFLFLWGRAAVCLSPHFPSGKCYGSCCRRHPPLPSLSRSGSAYRQRKGNPQPQEMNPLFSSSLTSWRCLSPSNVGVVLIHPLLPCTRAALSLPPWSGVVSQLSFFGWCCFSPSSGERAAGRCCLPFLVFASGAVFLLGVAVSHLSFCVVLLSSSFFGWCCLFFYGNDGPVGQDHGHHLKGSNLGVLRESSCDWPLSNKPFINHDILWVRVP